MNASVNLAILLRQDWRTTEGIARVQAAAASLGIEVTTGGRASVSGKMSETAFTQLFGVTPSPVAPRAPSAQDFGSPGGYHVEETLPIPAELLDYVESIEVAPPAIRMHQTP